MLVGLIADTHGLLRPEVAEAFAGVEHVFHAGDVGSQDVLDGLATNGIDNNEAIEREVNGRVRELCSRFPIYQG